MNIVTGICLAYMICLIAVFVIRICALDRAGRLKFLKSFKKGKFALIYFAAVPLYWLGVVYEGASVGGGLLTAIKTSIELVVLKYNYEIVAALMNDSMFYRVTLDICFALVAINAVAFVLSILGQRLYNACKTFKARVNKRKVFVLIGDNEANRCIAKSPKPEDSRIIMLAETSESLRDFAFVNGLAIVNFAAGKGLKDKLRKLFRRFDDKVVDVIVNTGDDAFNLICVEQISGLILEADLDKYVIDERRGINCYVFGDTQNESAFVHFVKKTSGCVHYVNKYKIIASDFAGRYPLTQFMTSRHIDYNSATIRDDVDLNVALIGFGDTNEQIFLTSVANNQFLTVRGGETVDKPVNYWIYDKRDSKSDKKLNHGYFRYSEAYEGLLAKKEDYLPLPNKPANVKFFELDINSAGFYGSLQENLCAKDGKIPFNYIIIGYGSDMENIDFAEKIHEKLIDWGIADRTKVFVKVRDDLLSSTVIDKEYAPFDDYITFSNEAQTVYRFDKIIEDKAEAMARDRHLCYELAANTEDKEEGAILKKANKKWYSWQQVQREANIFACLSIRLKLQLMGFDVTGKYDGDSVAFEQYMRKYTEGDAIKYSGETVRDKKIVDYGDCEFARGTLRNNLAIQEHQRWNAYQICCGYIPATLEEIKNLDKESLIRLRKHRNITTFDGLTEYKRIIAQATGIKEAEADVIKFDYQLMDDVCWLLERSGYGMIKRED